MPLLAGVRVLADWGSAMAGAFTIGESVIGGTDVLSGSADDDLSGRTLSVEIDRGRSSDLQAVDAGRARVVVHDPDGIYNPANPTSPIASRVRPMRRLTVEAEHGLVARNRIPRMLGSRRGRQTVFKGWVTRIEHDPSLGVKQTTMDAADDFEILSAHNPIIAEMGATTIGAAIRAVLVDCGLTDQDAWRIDQGIAITGFSADGGTSGVALIQSLVDVDRGVFYVAGDGAVVYRSRTTLLGRQASQATVPAAFVGAVRPVVDVRNVVNRQVVTRTGGTAQVAEDTTSQTFYRQRTGSPVESALFVADSQALDLARWIVFANKDPNVSARSIDLPGLTSTVLNLQIGRDVGDVVTLDAPGSGGTRVTGRIEGVAHRIEHDQWRTTWTVVPTRFSAFTIGESTIGGPDLIGP